MLKSISSIAAAIRSSLSTGVLAIAGPANGTTRTMTVPNADFTVARTDAAQTFTGTQTFSAGITGASGFQISGFTSYRSSGGSASSPGDAAIYYNAATGYTLQARAGSSYDWSLIDPGNNNYIARNPTGTLDMQFLGAVAVTGALSKGSGSFRIEHPLPAKKQTHYLVHSFIEGPQADLIYRGVVQLVSGKAQVNIDVAAGMTDGTFVALCRDVQCFTSNESDWTAVKGHVVGNILNIEAQDKTCSAKVSWMVVGERQDAHMMNADWTDENGKVVVEPLRSQQSDDSRVPEQSA